MKTVLLPVKDFRSAKQRLSQRLIPRQRAELARAMLQDVLNAIAGACSAQRVVVYTASEEVEEIVRPYNFDLIQEVTVRGHSDAVNLMVEDLSRDASRILAIASDLPTVTPQDVDFVLDSAPSDVGFVTSRDGTGTNAALFVLPA